MHKTNGREIKLNEGQAEAIAARKGPVLVVAGAGTGKTSVLVQRITQLISEGVEPKRILALTFTEKAAAEMQDRVSSALHTIHTDLPMLTFNAYGESLLRRYASDIGMGRNFRLIGENAQLVFLRERLDQLQLDYFAPVSSPDGQLSNLSAYFSKLKQNVITPEHYEKFVVSMPASDEAEQLDKSKHRELANAYGRYIKLMKEADRIDYDDQIYLAIQLLKERPNVLKEVQNAYDYVMVDEFQDTNAMQSVLVDMIVGNPEVINKLHAAETVSVQSREAQASRIDNTVQRESQGSKPEMASKNSESAALPAKQNSGACNLFVVGDDDQSIYGWRGATLANILDFKNRYPNAADITLVENYRSTNEILDCAYKLIQHNNPHRLEEQLKINKKLVGQKSGASPVVNCFESVDEELHWIAEDIKKRIKDGTNPGDIAVLARRNNTLERIHTKLELENIDHVVIGQRFELYKEAIVRNIIEAIKAVVDPLDSTSLYHTLTGPFFSQPIHPLNELAANARRTHQKLADAIDESDAEDLKKALQRIQEWAAKSNEVNVGQLAYRILDESGYKDRILQDPDTHGVTAQRLNDFFQTLREFEGIAVVPSALQYVESLPALQSAGESLEDGTLDLSANVVNVLSIHKSKGLEWQLVYIVDCTEGSFPLTARSTGIELPDGLASATQSEADDHMREERRLMYVAMTRAKDSLILTYSTRHSSATTRKPSRFIAEAFTGDDISNIESSGNTSLQVLPHQSIAKHDIEIPKTILHDGQVELTVSQVKTYLDCPLDFYYKYVLCVPQEPGFSSSYGTLMHSLLEELNRCIYDGREIDHASLESQLVRAWPQFGHASAAQRDRALAHAKKVLERLCHDIKASPRQPLAIEESFKISLPEHKLTVRGRFDAVFPLGNSVEIVDYKTSSSVDTPEKAKSRASGSEQLTLYALAWQMMHDELPALVTLDFIDTGKRGSLKKTQRGLDGAVTRLTKVADGIRANDFNPGRDHKFCTHPDID